jgi:hypothetical protein
VKEYGLSRAEGVLLRYLSEAYRALERTVPEALKTEELQDVIDWLGGELASVDDSLLQEWRRLRDPTLQALEPEVEEAKNITTDRRAFIVLLRNHVWRLVQAFSRKDTHGLVLQLRSLAQEDPGWTAETLAQSIDAYFDEYETLRVDPVARNPKYLEIVEGDETWTLRQILVDPEEDQSWSLAFSLSLAACRERDAIILRLVAIDRG